MAEEVNILTELMSSVALFPSFLVNTEASLFDKKTSGSMKDFILLKRNRSYISTYFDISTEALHSHNQLDISQ